MGSARHLEEHLVVGQGAEVALAVEHLDSDETKAPPISGETPIDNTTQVTLSGPDGAEIRYTVDGSAPTAESQLYSEAFTLTDTVLVKAIAIKNGVSSEVASKTFTKNGSGDNGGGFDTGS